MNKFFGTKFKLSAQLASLAVLVVFGYQNCAPGALDSRSMASSADSTTSFSECDNGVCEVIDQKVVAVSNSQNTLSSMLQQTGVTPSNATRTAFTAQAGKISETGSADTITAPMWVALTTVGSEVCNDLLTQEKALAAADRRFFNSVDFTKGFNMLTAEAKENSIRRLARAVWARNESGQERILIRAAVDEAFSGSTAVADTDKAAFFICTTMLSSMRAHTY